MAGETLKTPELIGGDHLTTNTVACHNGMVWFQEYQTNRLMVMPLGRPAEATNPGDLKTLSEPVLVRNRHIAFRGEDDKLMLVTCAAPNLHGQLGTETCLSAPSFGGGYLYFQGAKNSLMRAAIDRNERNVLAVGHCTGRPAVREMRPDRVWYPSDSRSAGGNFYVQQIDLATLRQGKNYYGNGVDLCMAPNGQLWLIEMGLLSYPWVFTNIYGNFEYGMAGKLQADPIRPCVPHGADRNIYYVFRGDRFRASAIPGSTDWAPVTPEFGDDGYVYWQTIGDKLLMAPRNATFTPTTELGSTNAQPDVIGSGRIIFRALDNTLRLREPGESPI